MGYNPHANVCEWFDFECKLPVIKFTSKSYTDGDTVLYKHFSIKL